MSERQERCETCRFWEEGDSRGVGECHRLPPSLIEGQFVDRTDVVFPKEPRRRVFPETDNGDWCGEWRDRVAKSQAADILSLPVSSISDGKHWQWIFRELGVDTVGQLCEKTSLELTDNRIFSRSRLVYLRGRLALFGLKLKGD